VNRLLSVSGLAHGRSGVEVQKSGNAGDPNLLEAAIGTGSSWTSGTPGQQLEALRLSHSTTSSIPTWHGNDDCIRRSRLIRKKKSRGDAGAGWDEGGCVQSVQSDRSVEARGNGVATHAHSAFCGRTPWRRETDYERACRLCTVA
jgi:hypothetical protein